jgi:hypothetical protein
VSKIEIRRRYRVRVRCEVGGSAEVVGEDGDFERDRYVDGELE